ncbi:hypothetical protein SDC9_198584 [bioreactor metagenome]|uniref:Uncharacterized protein n=1 Tax=bioreactor metagenome TaxID=1076179 RepID=A0A645IRD2_9ZZZZ
MHNFPPFFSKHFNVSRREVIESDVANKSPVYPHFFHGMEVFNNPFPGDVIGDPVPVNTGLNRVGWGNKTGFQGF